MSVISMKQLLEAGVHFGHQTRRIRNGKARTDKFEHVKYGDKYLEDNFFEKMEEAMEKCRI
mgnify:CR=1 FL=1